VDLFVIFCTISLTLVYNSFFEWTLHRYFMHRPFLGWQYPFERHAQTHHALFKADESYHLREEKNKWTIPMAWWNGPAIAMVATLPTLPFGWLGGWNIPLIVFCVSFCYYGTYEYLHWCMHLPRGRRVERTGLFFRLNGHHVLHHRYPDRNLNVVFPLADFCLRTLLMRAPTRFKQVQGYMVPDVQP